jgi:hypothetical protein
MPDYGFSGKPMTTGWSPARMAGAFHELMLRLDYPRYVSQGGGWGAIISELLAVQAPRSYCEGTQAGGGPFDAFDIPSLRPRSRCSRPRSTARHEPGASRASAT